MRCVHLRMIPCSDTYNRSVIANTVQHSLILVLCTLGVKKRVLSYPVTFDSYCTLVVGQKKAKCLCRQKEKKYTTGGIPRWSPTLVLVARFSAYVCLAGTGLYTSVGGTCYIDFSLSLSLSLSPAIRFWHGNNSIHTTRD
jgi:hypothetical protein